MIQMHKPAMLVLLEIRMADPKKLTEEMHFDLLIQSLTVGFSSWIVLIWKADCVQVADVSTAPQGIHAMVKVLPSHTPWLFSSIYASNLLTEIRLLWENLVVISRNYLGTGL